MRREIARPTLLTGIGAAITVAAIAGTAGFILGRQPMLRQFVPVHFSREGLPDRWLESSYALILMPVWVQLILVLVFGAIAALLLYRARPDEDSPSALPRQDTERMLITAEAVSLLAAIWVTFQGLAAVRIMGLWQRGFGGLGGVYGQTLVVAIVASVVVGIRAASYLRQPSASPRPSPDGHWRFRGLYFNPRDPALFVPVRSGIGWTLNFGRPGAILVMTIALMLGLGAPLVIMSFLLGE